MEILLGKDVTVDYLNEIAKGFLAGEFGVETLTLEEGKLTSRMKITKSHLSIHGYLHAASVIALADTSCGNAAFAHVPEGSAGFTTIELKSNHIGSETEGNLLCTATAQHLGRTTQVWDAVVTSEKTGKKIAVFRCTQAVLWPKN